MAILFTMPGKHGDVLWALPAVRALSERYQTPVDLMISARYGSASFAELLGSQPYIGGVIVNQDWAIRDTAPMTPAQPPLDQPWRDRYALVVHGGYTGWPSEPLPYEIGTTVTAQLPPPVVSLRVDLTRPWIEPPVPEFRPFPRDVVVGFTDEHFELKYGLYRVIENDCLAHALLSAGSRWHLETPLPDCSWVEAAHLIARAKVFLGCCSALHVLAVAIGVPAVVMEPNPMRHHPIFYPCGTTGPQVTLVLGHDAKPTFDARAVAQAIDRVLKSAAR